MKHCANPECDSTFIFSDSRTVCPFCHGALESNSSSQGVPATLESILMNNEIGSVQTNPSIPFARRIPGGYMFHGRITELENHEVFNSKWHKIFNSLVRGEPYQFAYQTSEYAMRIENISDGYSTETTDICLFGNYLGRIHVGDEVEVSVKDYRSRRVARLLYNHTTGSFVKPGLQISSTVVRVIAIGIIAVVTFILVGLIWLIKSGILLEGILSLIMSLLPTLIIALIIWGFINSLISGRFWRKR